MDEERLALLTGQHAALMTAVSALFMTAEDPDFLLRAMRDLQKGAGDLELSDFAMDRGIPPPLLAKVRKARDGQMQHLMDLLKE
ncbi:hypothetical protein [Solilutibacter silvestris]|uniref:hypothetical protein n=1 Tax=Solilutibacter silvestris TaxID=1645665 RepID=UPI003D3427BD